MNGAYTSQPTTDTKNTYVWWDDARQNQIVYKPNVSQSTTNTATFTYDAGGRISSVYIADGRPRSVSYVTDVSG